MTSDSTIGNAFYYYYYYGGSFDIAERIGNLTIADQRDCEHVGDTGAHRWTAGRRDRDVGESRGPVRAVQRSVPWHSWFRNGEAVADP